MSSSIVRKLLRAPPAEPEQSMLKRDRGYKAAQHGASNKSASVSISAQDAMDWQVRYLLRVDSDKISSLSTPKKKKRKKQETAHDSEVIVTNSRGTAAMASREFTRTSNKRKYAAQKKEEYFQKIARQLRKDDVKKKRKK